MQDDGCGMTPETVKTVWMNPATPAKFLAKKRGMHRTSERNRVIQGEKGIGRFAVLKLAKKITVTTRVRGAATETMVSYDFTRFDDDFVEEAGEEKEIFLDEVKVEWDERAPKTLLGSVRGTVIEMEALRGAWSDWLIERLCRDVANLTDPVSRLTRKDVADRFEINVVCNGKRRAIAHDEEETLKALIEEKPVFSIEGSFLNAGCVYRFNSGSGDEEVSLYDESVKGLWIWRQRFPDIKARREAGVKQVYGCGDFAFQFYIFDFARGIDSRYLLTQNDKNRLKNHRVYLYRDGVRVYPYGDPDDDWLNIDTSRGIGRAGDFFSNDPNHWVGGHYPGRQSDAAGQDQPGGIDRDRWRSRGFRVSDWNISFLHKAAPVPALPNETIAEEYSKVRARRRCIGSPVEAETILKGGRRASTRTGTVKDRIGVPTGTRFSVSTCGSH